MSVSRSIIFASSSTARVTPSMRPASSLNSTVCMVPPVFAKVMAQLCRKKPFCAPGKLGICLEAASGVNQGSFQ